MSQAKTQLVTACWLLAAACAPAGPDSVGATQTALTAPAGEARTAKLEVRAAGTVVDASLIKRAELQLPVPVPVRPGLIDLEAGKDKDAPAPKDAPSAQPSACGSTALWLASKQADKCPEVGAMEGGRWLGRRVFGEQAPPALARVCAYDWVASGDNGAAEPNLDQLRSALSNHGDIAPELDCPVLSSLDDGAALDDELWRAMRDTALERAGRVQQAPPLLAKTQVAVIDSALFALSDSVNQDEYGHGRLVGRLIEDLTCFDSAEDKSSDDPAKSRRGQTCSTRIENHLALPWLDAHTFHTGNGGSIGTRENLAHAIDQAVSSFAGAALKDGRATRHLVLNLSVGWDPEHGGGAEKLPSELSPASYTVYAALARASCLGVASVAAAGNAHGASFKEPVLPAAWEAWPSPSAAECKELIDARTDRALLRRLPRGDQERESLVVAAFGVDPYDAPLATTRELSVPRLAAYALSMVSDDEREPAGHTLVLSGTSFAAALTTAALASSWSVAPELTRKQALDLVHKSGTELPLKANLCLDGCQEVRRVSVCQALALAACEAGDCSAAAPCPEGKARGGAALWSEALFERSSDTALTSAPALVNPMTSSTPSALADPWCHGQPPRAGCRRCAIRPRDDSVSVELEPEALATTRQMFVVSDSAATVINAPGGGTSYPASFTASVLVTPGARAVLVRDVGLPGSPAYVAEDIAVVEE